MGDSTLCLLLIALVIALDLPFLFHHPGLIREDWEYIARAHHLGSLHAAPSIVARHRPLVALIFAGIYGIAAAHLLLAHWLLVLAAAMLPAIFFTLLKRFVSRSMAAGAAVLWCLLPTHLTLDHWLAVGNITLGVLCVLLGLLLVDIAIERPERPIRPMAVLAIALLVTSVGSYEALALPAFFGAVCIPFWRRKRCPQWRLAALGGALPVLLATAVAVVLETDRRRMLASPVRAAIANIGVLYERPQAATVFMMLVIVGVGVAVLRFGRSRRCRSTADAMVLVGLVLIVVGYLPFATSGFDVTFIGLGDRMNVVTSFGVALLLSGLSTLLVRPPVGAVTIVALVALVFVPVGMHRSADWTRATGDSSAGARRLMAEKPQSPAVLQCVDDASASSRRLGLFPAYDVEAALNSGRFGDLGPVAYSTPFGDSRLCILRG